MTEQPESRIQALLDECKTVAENCGYTAQAHFAAAAKAQWWSRLLLTGFSAIAAVAGFSTAVGAPKLFGAFAAAGGLVTAVASYLGVDRDVTRHKIAGNLLTSLRHEARALHETFGRDLSPNELLCEVRRLSDRYNCLTESLEITDKKSYEEGRRLIKSGLFDMDHRAK